MLVNSNYLFLTSFNKRTGDYKMLFRTRKEGNVVKDGEKVMKLNIAPDKSPYKTGLNMPYTKHNFRNKIKEELMPREIESILVQFKEGNKKLAF